MRRGNEERFVAKTSVVQSHLIWLAGCQFRLDDGRRMEPYRAAWIMARGEVPEGMAVIRSCGNNCCVHVEHLRLATMSEASQIGNARRAL